MAAILGFIVLLILVIVILGRLLNWISGIISGVNFNGILSTLQLIIVIPVVLLGVWILWRILRRFLPGKVTTYSYEMKAPELPTEIRPISGSFICKSCGGKTIIKEETNPSFSCKFCGSRLDDLAELIKTRQLELNEERNRIIEQGYKAMDQDIEEDK